MKIKIFFLISAMNALSYLCFGNCCGDCCGDCWKKEENGKNEKKDKFVNKNWLDKKEEQGGFVLKLFNKEGEKKYKSEDNNITIELEEKKGKTEIKNSDEIKDNLKTDTHKWALFEIKYKEEGKDKFVYLYCNDIESKEKDPLCGIFEKKEDILKISVLACDTSEVINMSCMFYKCSNLGDLDLSDFNTSKVTDMNSMFSGCSSLETLNLSKFDISNVNFIAFMFDTCNKLNKVIVSKNGDTKNKILKQLNEDIRDWKEEKNIEENICTLIKVEEKKSNI